MTDDPAGPSAQVASGIEALLEGVRSDMRAMDRRHSDEIKGLRDDVREDNARTEERVMTALQATARAHATEHREENEERQQFHERVDRFINAAELAQARKDGALGVFRFVIEVLGRHSRPIAQILAGAGVMLGIASGSISISLH